MIERWICGLAVFCTCFGGLAAPIDWPHLKLTRAAQGLNEPVVVTGAHDGTGRVFIAERFGKIKVLVNGEILPEPFLDISPKVRTEHYSHGIMGVAFPPAFGARQHFYVHYTPNANVVVLSRFHIPPGSSVAASDSEEVLLTTHLADQGPSVGEIAFGPDGYLYLGREATEYYQPQHFDNVLGKILRIDVESSTSGYAIPTNNPFASHATHRREIWSWGLVHPHSLSFDRLTGDLYLTDQQGMRCEVNFQLAGRGGVDYGAPIPEYTYNDPLATYERQGAMPPAFIMTTSETYGLTGHICRDSPPSRMNGILFLGYLHSGHLAGVRRDGTNWGRQNFPEAITTAHNFGEDDSGRLYAMSRYEGTIDLIEDSGKARPPELPPSGVIHTDTPVLTSPTPGSRIRYTTNGINPAPGDPEIPSGQSITISTGMMTVKAQALRDDLLPSDIAIATYTSFKVAFPVFVPGPSPIPNPASITITSATPGAIIRYTTNGTHPTSSSPIYSSPIIVPGDAVVFARAYKNGFQDSELNGATYTWATAQVPTFDPASGPITNATWITMTSPTPGAKIRYTLDGTVPVASSLRYTNRIRINGNTTVKAITFAKGYKPSAITTTRFDLVRPARPVITPVSGIVSYGATIQITSATPRVTIRYTTNGLSPSTSSPVYSSAITIHRDTLVKARAFKSQMDPSPVAVGDFRLLKAEAPVVTPADGVITNGTRVTMRSLTSAAQIRYTLDGSDPGPNSPIFNKKLSVPAPVVLKARSYAPELSPSDVTVAEYRALVLQPTIVQTIAGNGEPGFIDGPPQTARFRFPHGVCRDNHGTIYVADTGNNAIRKIDTNGVVSTFAGSGMKAHIDGVGTNAAFVEPTGIAIDPKGRLYVGDSSSGVIRLITTNGNVRSVYTIFNPYIPGLWQITLSPQGLLYIGTFRRIIMMNAAGNAWLFYDGVEDCHQTWGNFGGGTAVALDASNRVYAVSGQYLFTFDGQCDQIFAGSPFGFSDGPRKKAGFVVASGIAIARNGKIFITDDNCVRMMETNGYVSTLAGFGPKGFRNGPSSIAQFQANTGICLATNGSVYITDAGNHAIRRISFDHDQDTIPDPDEKTTGPFRLARNDALIDNDADGYTNAEEFWAATNPNNSNSTLKLEARYAGSNAIALSWPTAPSRSYTVVTSTNLSDWPMTLPAIPGDGTVKSLTNSFTPASRTFYRLRVDP